MLGLVDDTIPAAPLLHLLLDAGEIFGECEYDSGVEEPLGDVQVAVLVGQRHGEGQEQARHPGVVEAVQPDQDDDPPELAPDSVLQPLLLGLPLALLRLLRHVVLEDNKVRYISIR